MKIDSCILPNGIRLIHQQVESPAAHFGVILNTGSRDELDHEQGIAHFIEHVIFKGTQKRKAYHVLSRIEDVGGEINAYTTKEETAVYATFLARYYSRSMELISDIIRHSSFPERELEKEKEVIIEEINSYKDSPSELIFDDFDELLFAGHPIARNILGTPKLVKSFKRTDVLRFIENNYHTDEMVLASVGSIPFARFKTLAEKYFADIPAKARSHQRQLFTGYQPAVKRIAMDTYQAHCVMGNIAYNAQDDKRMGMVLLNSILGGQSMNSRLNLSLRERNGMAYNVESNYTAYSDTGQFNVYFGTDKENLEKAIRLVKKEFKLIREKRLGALQLSKAKKQLIGQIAISSENRDDLMLTLGKSFLLYNKIDSLPEIYQKIEKISDSQLLDIANEVLDEKALSLLIYE
ncbi:pitrilysin family protein [Mangrovibacterium marinum]|uniref:Putative Zn-dependent peptidase n=1 Tax=Mangrovibacterium marinum TaxID=1639118 RepID=A0A2T5C241_9BACT|nr:pitrilysin family protein [Mangrovibacterium marinum]PTN08736.1 putative Zn-dependent peptidase [Mangrovibacterium marinum]